MDSIFIFLDRIYRINGIFFACGRGPSAEGRSILTILLILSNCFLKIRIHSIFFCCASISILVRLIGNYSFFLD